MGGSSGIALVDNLNPFHQDANRSGGETVGNILSGIGNSANNMTSHFGNEVNREGKGIAALGAFVGGMAALGGATAAEAGVANSGYLGFTSAEPAATGVGYLGTETTLSGTGMAAAELGGAGASSVPAVSYTSGYLGANMGGLSTYGSSVGSGLGYLGADVGSVASSNQGLGYLGANTAGLSEAASPGLLSYLPSGKDALSYATALGLLNRGNPQAAADALKGTSIGGYIPNINIETPNFQTPDWLGGLLGSQPQGGGAKNQINASAAYPSQTQGMGGNAKTAVALALVAGALYLAKKKRVI